MGTPAEGSIQVAGAPNDRSRMARRGPAAENNARSGCSRALRACAAKPRSFPPPRGRCAPRKCGRASPNALSVRFRRLSGRGIAPAARRRAGCCTPVRSSVAGRRRLWPKANRRRRGGQGGEAPRALLWFLSWASKKGTRCRSTTDKLRRSMSDISKAPLPAGAGPGDSAAS